MTTGPKKPPPHAWKPGQSGNPAGRRPGSGEVARLRDGIKAHIPAIVDKLVEQAKAGDAQAARLLIERVIPPMKAMEMPAAVALAGDTLTDQGRSVLDAVGVGELAPGQAASLLASLGALAKLAEADELTRRVERLEARTGAVS